MNHKFNLILLKNIDQKQIIQQNKFQAFPALLVKIQINLEVLPKETSLKSLIK